jgi:hypothetical protein
MLLPTYLRLVYVAAYLRDGKDRLYLILSSEKKIGQRVFYSVFSYLICDRVESEPTWID